MERGRGAALRGVWMLEPGRDGLAFEKESRMHRGQLGYRGPRPGPAQQGASRFHGRLRSRRLRSAAHVERGRYQCAVDWKLLLLVPCTTSTSRILLLVLVVSSYYY